MEATVFSRHAGFRALILHKSSTGKTGIDSGKQKGAQQLIWMMHGLNGVFHPTVLYPIQEPLQGFGAVSSGGATQPKRARGGPGRWVAKQQEAERLLANCQPASTPAFVLQPGLGAPQLRQNVTFPGQSNELLRKLQASEAARQAAEQKLAAAGAAQEADLMTRRDLDEMPRRSARPPRVVGF